jgi:uncharacterized membrane protein YkgB
MPGFLTVLPLAFVMVAGPQIITAVLLASSENWRKNSAAFLAGVLITVTFFVTASYIIVKQLKSAAGESHERGSGRVIDVAILLLLLVAAALVFRGRKTAEPPKWMGKLLTATPKASFKLGLFLLGVFPTDIITSFAVGSHLATNGDPWWHCLSFVFATLLLAALPVILVLVGGKRAEVYLPKARAWMTANSWIVSEIVIALFIAIEINSLAGS